MFIDGRGLDGQSLEAALCIIGGGAAGIAIAHEFLETGMSVIIIESGGFEVDPKVQTLNEAESTGLHTSIDEARLRFFGGCTNHWEGLCTPLDDIDFEERSWVTNSGWPINLKEITPYYQKASRFLNLSGNSNDDFNVPQDILPLTNKLALRTWRSAHNLTFSETSREILGKSEYIRILLNSTVTNIEANTDVSQVIKINVATVEGQRFNVIAKNYILAAGGIENARLLLLSRNQMAAGLGNQNDLVGRFFLQHPHHEVAKIYSWGQPPELLRFREFTGPGIGQRTLSKPPSMLNIALSREAMQTHKLLNASLSVNTISLHEGPPPREAELMRHIWRPESTSLYQIGLYTRAEQAPDPNSRVMLSNKKKDVLGLPIVKLHWRLTEQEWRTIKQLTIFVAELVSAQKLGVLKVQPWAQAYHWPIDLFDGCHHMGTTRMHDDPKSGVVDRHCRVHGIDNLYIAGSSVYPTSGWANPTYTLIALAIRLAKHLKSNVS